MTDKWGRAVINVGLPIRSDEVATKHRRSTARFQHCIHGRSDRLGALDLILSRERPTLVRCLALIDTLGLASMTAVSLRYFFAAPTCFLVIALILFFLAWIKLPTSVG